MKKKLILIIMLLLLLINLTGCWDSVELNKRVFITAFGLDKADDNGEIAVTFQTIIPANIGTATKPGSENKRAVHVMTITADSLINAMRLFSLNINGKPNLQQNSIIVIGTELAAEGVGSIMDFFLRNFENNPRAIVLVSEDKASDILEWQSEISRIPSDYIVSLIGNKDYISSGITEDLHQFSMKLFSKTDSPLTGRIRIVKKQDKSPGIDMSETAVFKKDRLAGWLNTSETRGLAWILNKFGNGTVEVSNIGRDNITLTLFVTMSNTKLKPEFINGRMEINMEVNGEGRLYMQGGNLDVSSPESIELIEKELVGSIRNDIEACAEKVQKVYKTDVLGFGEAIHRKFPKEWKAMEVKWDEEFPEINYKINVKMKVKNVGAVISVK